MYRPPELILTPLPRYPHTHTCTFKWCDVNCSASNDVWSIWSPFDIFGMTSLTGDCRRRTNMPRGRPVRRPPLRRPVPVHRDSRVVCGTRREGPTDPVRVSVVVGLVPGSSMKTSLLRSEENSVPRGRPLCRLVSGHSGREPSHRHVTLWIVCGGRGRLRRTSPKPSGRSRHRNVCWGSQKCS